MKNKHFKVLIEIAFILLIGLIPLFWFRGNQVFLGHDSGLTISPLTHFFDRLYLWTHRYGLGHDQTYALPGFFIHGLEALVSYLGFSLQANQKIIFIFWFLLPGLSMYIFARNIEKRIKVYHMALPASVIYMINHYLLQGWFIAERTKFSLYAALPLMLLFLFNWQERKCSTLKTALYISLTFFFLNGMASLPLFGGILIVITVFILFHFLWNKNILGLYRLIKLFGAIAIISAGLHAYWLLAYIQYVRNSYSEVVGQAGGVSGVLGWISYISQNTSLLNLMRLQGVPEWYQNPDHPYANDYLYNPILIFVSFLIPFSAFYALRYLEAVNRKYIIFFSFLALFSMIFIAGSHPPFGGFYRFLVLYVPGFLAFRTPFYKFAPALWFSFSILIGITFSTFTEKILSNKFPRLTLPVSIIFCLLIIFYNYPILDGRFFDYIKGQRSMRVEIPGYVLDFSRWSENPQIINQKILPLPPAPASVETYKWGYWSLTPLTSLISNATVINQNGLKLNERGMIQEIYKRIKKSDNNWIKYAKIMNIKYLLLRNDIMWDAKTSLTIDPIIYQKVLEKTTEIKLLKKFGQWSVYVFTDDSDKNQVFSKNQLHYVEGKAVDIPDVISLPGVKTDAVYYSSDSYAENPALLLTKAKDIFVVPQCIFCLLRFKSLDEGSFYPTFTPDSILYPIIEARELTEEQNLKFRPELEVDYYLDSSLKKQKGLERVVDEKKTNEAIIASAKAYSLSLKKLHRSFKKLIKQNRLENNDLLLKGYTYIYLETNNIIQKSGFIANAIDRQLFSEIFNDLYTIMNLLRNNIWYTSNLTQKKLLFTIPESGEYSVYLKADTLSDTTIIPDREISFNINSNKFKMQPFLENGWIKLIKMDFSKGMHKLLLEDIPQLDLYSDKKNILVIDKTNESHSCFSTSVISSEADAIYDITFEYRQIIGNATFYFHPLGTKDFLSILSKQGTDLKNNSSWEKMRTSYQAGDDNGFYFYICSRPQLTQNKHESQLELRNITVYKVTEPKIVLWKKQEKGLSGIKELNILQSDQTEYRIVSNSGIKGDFLVLNQSYNVHWKLSGLSGSKFIANGYANGWLITKEGNFGKVVFNSQKYVRYGFAISILVFLIAVGAVVYLRKVEQK